MFTCEAAIKLLQHCAAPHLLPPFVCQVVSLVAPAPDLDNELRIPRPSLHPVTWAGA